eukprot:scaffold12009_cov61-Cyclotella_meneghiniana.AAC.5
MTSNNITSDLLLAVLEAMYDCLRVSTWLSLEVTSGEKKHDYCLMDYLNLNTDEMSMLMSTCGLDGRKVRDKWKDVFTPSRIIPDYELDKTSVSGVGRQWVIKFGQSKVGSVDNMNQQIRLTPPRIASHSFITSRRELKNHLRSLMASSNDDSNDGSVVASSNKSSDESLDDNTINGNDNVDEPDQTTAAAPNIIDLSNITNMSTEYIQSLQYKLYQEQVCRSPNNSKVFSMQHFHGEIICIPVPKKHKSEDAFDTYQRKFSYVKEFCIAAGGGDEDLGVMRVLSYLASRNQDCYLECGKKAGVALTDIMDTTALAAMMTDCNLKQWQLLNILKHIRHSTGAKICENPDKLKNFEADLVMPETGSYRYNYINKHGEEASELVEYDYQSMTAVFRHVVAQLLMENSITDLTKVRRVGVVNGADHGKGALRRAFRTLILLDDGKVLYKDVGNSTVFTSKDTSEVLKNTIQD